MAGNEIERIQTAALIWLRNWIECGQASHRPLVIAVADDVIGSSKEGLHGAYTTFLDRYVRPRSKLAESCVKNGERVREAYERLRVWADRVKPYNTLDAKDTRELQELLKEAALIIEAGLKTGKLEA